MRALATVRTRAYGEDPGRRFQGPGNGDDGQGGGRAVWAQAGTSGALPEVTVPLVTLQGRAARAGGEPAARPPGPGPGP